MKTNGNHASLLQTTRGLLKQQLDNTSAEPEIKQLDALKKTLGVGAEKAAVFEGGASSQVGTVGETSPKRSASKLNASRGLKLGARTMQRIKTGFKLASLGMLMSMSLVANDANAQSAQTAPTNPLMTRVQVMTHNLDNATAKNVRTDFVMTNVDNRNEGVVEFRIKDNKRNSTLVKALTDASSVTLPVPWGTGDGLGSAADVSREDGFVVIRAEARGDAFSSTDTDPMVFVQGDSLSGRIDLDVKKMEVNENAFYHGLSQSSLDRTTAQRDSALEQLKTGIESGTIAPESDDAKGLQSLIQTLQENIDVQTRQLGMDWSTKLTIGDGK